MQRKNTAARPSEQTSPIPADLLRRAAGIVSERLGLHTVPRDHKKLEACLRQRMQANGLSHPAAYLERLQNSHTRDDEWDALICRLTVGESYFFRDPGQMDLLKGTVLPDLLQCCGQRRRLRLWSAGCSTGEEPYSLAILIDQLLPGYGDWDISILGTDINNQALETARSGQYGAWSLRNTPPDLKERYFVEAGRCWRLRPDIRQRVVFKQLNLIADAFPDRSSGPCDIDLIVCRNVFIYFEQPTVGRVIDKMAATLAPDGYLLTGHAELLQQVPETLRTQRTPRSHIYRRDAPGTVAPPRPLPTPTPRPTTRPQPPQLAPRPPAALRDPLEEAEHRFRQEDWSTALDRCGALLADQPDHPRGLQIAALAAANLGRRRDAMAHCRSAAQAEPFAAWPHSLMAQILEEEGDAAAAKMHLKKAIYLEPESIAPYIELAALYQREDDAARARKMRATALTLLARLPDETPIEPYDETAAQLAAFLAGLQRRPTA